MSVPNKPLFRLFRQYSAIGSRIDGILFPSFRNQNRSQNNTITANAVYSHSGIVSKEQALETSFISVSNNTFTPIELVIVTWAESVERF